MVVTTPGSVVSLSYLLEDGDVTKFPRAFVFDTAQTLLTSVDLVHTFSGRYTGSYTTPSSPGVFTVQYASFVDAARTVPDLVHGQGEDRIVTQPSVWDLDRSGAGVPGSYGEALKVILGVAAKTNYRIDQMVYAANGFLDSARLRIFADAAAASSSTPGGSGEGEIYTVTLTGVPSVTFPDLPSTVLGLL